MHQLDDSIIGRLDDEAYELNKLYPTVTPEQVARMVSEGVPAIEEILGKAGAPVKPSASDEMADENEDMEETAPVQSYLPPVQATPFVAPVAPQPIAPAPAPAPAPQPAPVQQQYVPPVQPAPAQVAKPAPVAPKAPVASATEMSDEEFLKSIGAK
jgi:hypothetical protein